MITSAIYRRFQTATSLRPMNLLSKKLSLTPIRYLQTEVRFTKLSCKQNSAMTANELIFSAVPNGSESKIDFKTRVKQDVQKILFSSAFANHELFMSYPTRISKANETLSDVAHLLPDKKVAFDIPFNRPILPGHCLVSVINEKGEACDKLTFSLRPDPFKSTVYQAHVAHDSRLPKDMRNTVVKPATHTSVSQEIATWAEDAFYVSHVQKERPKYPLHCILKPLAVAERDQFCEAMKELKSFYQYYSLVDHILPHCELGSTVVTAQNCTVIIDLLEKLNKINLKKMIGNNPTPQVIISTIKNFFFETDVTKIRKSGALIEPKDEMDKPYVRK